MNPDSIIQKSAIVSGRVTAEQMDYAIRVARHRQKQADGSENKPLPDRQIADILVEQKVITEYQAGQLLAGRTILNLGPYIITDFIGQGGMGQVFKAVHQVMGRVCAVKVLPRSRHTQEAKDSFAREIQMQAKLDCPYLVRAFDAGQDGKVLYLVTEYVPGMDLRRLVRSRGPLPLHQAAKIIMHAALGLEHAHRVGLVHRDVKPGNVLVTPEGHAKVSDVGLAGFAHDLINDPRAGKIVGTADYISPEQIRTPLDIQAASDIYSLGGTLYYAVCAKVPFPGGDTSSKLRRHVDETPMHPRRFVPDIPEDFVDIIADMMEKDMSKRIQQASEVAARLEPWASEEVSVMIGMHRSPWLAPPPPSYDEGEPSQEVDGEGEATPVSPVSSQVFPPGLTSEGASESNVERPGLGSDVSSGGFQGGLSPWPESTAVPVSTRQSTAHMSSAMIVALTLAIAVPPALLVGAILGYLASQ
ncbi:MAG: serine/threonine protein kinase [Planctomycetales bacterium]|nr:serine/threonine protein kinase [Planctomycetales bacterium]